MLSHASGPVVESLAVLGSAALLIYAGRAIRANDLSAPALIQFMIVLLMIYDPIRKLNKVNLVLQEATAAGQRVTRLMDVPSDIEEKPDARTIDAVREGIRYERVSFSYGEDRAVLREVDLDIPAGQIVALVGPSGAEVDHGQPAAALLRSLLGAHRDRRHRHPRSDAREPAVADRSGDAGYGAVQRHHPRQHRLGRSDLPMERVREAAAAAYADEFIMQLPKGYDTVIGESGLRLSGRPAAAAGHRPRPAEERADPDPRRGHLQPRHAVRAAGAEGALQPDAGATTLVIAHRLSTVTKADRIVVMEAGRIVEEGSHDQLIAIDGAYKKLFDLQFRV